MTIAPDQLRFYIERIERLEEEKAGLAVDVCDVYTEARSNGFNPKIMRQIVNLRKKEAHELEEEECLLETYKRVLGMLPEDA